MLRLGQHHTFYEMNDIYSFGIFLLELISGKEVIEKEAFLSNDSLLQWVCVEPYLDPFIGSHVYSDFSNKHL